MYTKVDSLRHISSDGVEIRYWLNWKKGMNQRFVVLHPGAALNHSSLQHLEQGFNARGNPTINFDPRGSGYSDHPLSREYFKLERLSEDLEGILVKEGVQRPHIVAHSFGFMAAIDYAARTSNAAQLTGICASHHFPATAPNRLAFQIFDKLLIYTEYGGSIATSVLHTLRGEIREVPDQSRPSNPWELWLSIVDIPLRKAACHVIGQREVNNWDITPQLSQIQQPLLLIYGTKDRMVQQKGAVYIAQRTTAPIQIATVPGADHSLPVLQPNSVLQILDKYGMP